MNAADIELARMLYLVSSLAILLFTSMILRGLWQPLRFQLLAIAISILCTPFFVDQAMPDGSDQNVVPAFIVTMQKIASDHEHWREIVQETARPMLVVAGINCFLALILAFLLPKPKKKIRAPEKPKKAKKIPKNPYLPDDFQTDASTANASTPEK